MATATSRKPPDAEKRLDLLDEANRSLRTFKRTGVAYTFADVKKYILAKASGKSPRKPKPIKVPRAKR